MADDTVIYVPGFLGSYLTYKDEGEEPRILWLNPATMLAGGFAWMRLPIPDEPLPAPAAPVISPGLSLAFPPVFLVNYLERRGWRVLSALGDWRHSIVQDAARLAAQILEENKRGRVRLIGHSRGGLVIRAALKLLWPSGPVSGVVRVITLGTPHTGSLNAASTLAGWNPVIGKIGDLGRYLPFSLGEQLDEAHVVAALRSWPGVYELLPPPNAPWLSLTPADLLYNKATYRGSPLNPNASLLTSAKNFWAGLPPRQVGCDWIDVAGQGLWTWTGIPSPDAVSEAGSFGGDHSGDGVVPFPSAHQPPYRLITTPTHHDLIPADSRLFPVLADALADGLQADVAVAGKIFTLESPF